MEFAVLGGWLLLLAGLGWLHLARDLPGGRPIGLVAVAVASVVLATVAVAEVTG